MNVREQAGIIRPARGLRKCGFENCTGLRAERTSAAVLLHVPNLIDSAENAACLAAAKHLLDSYLGKPLIPKPAAQPQKVVALPSPPEEHLPISAPSD